MDDEREVVASIAAREDGQYAVAVLACGETTDHPIMPPGGNLDPLPVREGRAHRIGEMSPHQSFLIAPGARSHGVIPVLGRPTFRGSSCTS